GGEVRRLQQYAVPTLLQRHVVIRRHAIDAHDFVSGPDQVLCDVKANEPRCTSHQEAHAAFSFRVSFLVQPAGTASSAAKLMERLAKVALPCGLHRQKSSFHHALTTFSL